MIIENLTEEDYRNIKQLLITCEEVMTVLINNEAMSDNECIRTDIIVLIDKISDGLLKQ